MPASILVLLRVEHGLCVFGRTDAIQVRRDVIRIKADSLSQSRGHITSKSSHCNGFIFKNLQRKTNGEVVNNNATARERIVDSRNGCVIWINNHAAEVQFGAAEIRIPSKVTITDGNVAPITPANPCNIIDFDDNKAPTVNNNNEDENKSNVINEARIFGDNPPTQFLTPLDAIDLGFVLRRDKLGMLQMEYIVRSLP